MIVTGSNKKDLNCVSGPYNLFYTKQKYCDMLDNYSWSEKLEYEKSV